MRIITVALWLFVGLNGFSQKTGTDFFPIAVWLQDPSLAYSYRLAGINLYVGNTLDFQTLNQLKVDKMKVICHQNAFALSRLSDTTIYGWAQEDEPDNAQWNDITKQYDPCIDPSVIINKYDSMKAKDSTRPVYLNLGMGVSYTIWGGRGTCTGKTNMYPVYNDGYLKGCDIASFDIYPVNCSDGTVRNNLWYVPKGIDSLIKWVENKKPVWCWIETTRIDNNSLRKPTAAEVRSEVWMALIHGAKGFGYFCHSFYPVFDAAALLHDTAMFAAVTKINQRVKSLAPVLNSPNTSGYASVTSSNPLVPVDYITKHADTVDYIFAVAMRNGTTTVTVTIDSGNYVEVLDEGRTIYAPSGVFTDVFTSYAAHLYKITTRNDVSSEKMTHSESTVYPNPFNTYTTITVPYDIEEPFDVRLYNCLGEMVYSNSYNSRNIIIYRNNLKAGMYFYYISGCSDKPVITGKVVISD